ncbi:ribosomal protein L18ae family [Actinidia rufa]|uniref:Ribosomal protein L18ae family n=1 Tax=Actinidia rufa TaxID=165716 RepID=A0A7J0G3D1_9ERIC|nr:ribosomal protein L18ae family [Actinidia rufa]
MSEEGKERGVAGNDPYPPQYGTFQGVANYPPQPVIGFPQPVPPPGATASAPPPPPQYYAPGYQAVPGYAVAEGRPVRERRLPCCGCGVGWFLNMKFPKGNMWTEVLEIEVYWVIGLDETTALSSLKLEIVLGIN